LIQPWSGLGSIPLPRLPEKDPGHERPADQSNGAQLKFFWLIGTFVKLRKASLRYEFDRNTVRRWLGKAMGLEGLSLNIIGRNLITWTNYEGFDPETGVGTVGESVGSPAIRRVGDPAVQWSGLRHPT